MKTIRLSSTTLQVYDAGSGPVLLFVHGFPLSHFMWREQLADLHTSFRVIAPDLRGFGGSEVTPGTVSMEQYADDLAELLTALDVTGPVVLCGLSMGGYVAWQFFRRHRQRLRGLILCDTRAIADTPEGVINRQRLAMTALEQGTGPVAATMLPNLLAPATVENRPELLEELRRTIVNTPAEGLAAASLGMSLRPDMTGELGTIDLPALLIVGEHDRISTVEEMKGIAAAMPDARLEVIPAAGHMSPLENPGPVNTAIRHFMTDLN